MDERTWLSFSREDKMRFAMMHAAPWYIHFWAGWSSAIKSHQLDVHVVKYEHLLANPGETFSQVLALCGELALALTHTDAVGFTGKNKAIVGRGETFGQELQDYLKQMAQCYPNIDFSPVGL
ncbi:hypothetical protein ACFO3I_18075 [Rheinheimera marina]|uniref:Uncharacterized protein n=1 Tax=Rheinheimera marina TaxID=1774958 RepID=A0ABV9JRW0_9GAMM